MLPLYLQAEDGDADDYGLVWYQLTDPSTPLLVTLEEESGVLRLNQTLESLHSRVSPVFTATAFDNRGLSPSTTSMNILIVVGYKL